MDRLHGILVFLRVVEIGTLSGAARALGVSTSAISAALARLEAKLSVRLLNRTTRRLGVTPEGAELYARCKQIAADLEEVELAVSRAGRVPSGRLRVGLPRALGRLWIIPSLPAFMEAYPSVSLELLCSDFVPYTIENGLDVAVQVGELHASRLGVRRLATTRYAVCASQSYFSRHDVPCAPEDLGEHRCLVYRRPRTGRVREWRFRAGDGVRDLPVPGFMTFNSGEAMVAAARAGLGVIQVADYYVQPLLERGELVEVLEDYKTDGFDISVVFPQPQQIAPKLRVFLDFLVALFEHPPWRASGAAALRVARTRAASRRPRAVTPLPSGTAG